MSIIEKAKAQLAKVFGHEAPSQQVPERKPAPQVVDPWRGPYPRSQEQRERIRAQNALNAPSALDILHTRNAECQTGKHSMCPDRRGVTCLCECHDRP